MPHLNEVPWDADMRAASEFQAAPADGSGDVVCAAALNAKMVQSQQAASWRSVRAIAASAGEWPNVVLKAEVRPASDVVKAAINAVSLEDTALIDPADMAAWARFQGGLQLLEAAGDLSAQTVADIGALFISESPWWKSIGAASPLNEHDIYRAREGAAP